MDTETKAVPDGAGEWLDLDRHPQIWAAARAQGEVSYFRDLLTRFRDFVAERATQWDISKGPCNHHNPVWCEIAEALAAPSAAGGAEIRGEVGREPGAYGVPGMPDRLRASDQLRIFSAYYADRLPAAAAAALVTMADEWDEEVEATRSPLPLTDENQDRLIITDPGSVRDNGADLAGLSAAATQGELSAPDWGTDFRIGKVSVGMTSPAGDGNGRADRAFIVALWNGWRSGALVPTTSAPQAVASGQGDDGTSPLHRLTEAFWGWQWGGMGDRARSYAKNAMAFALQRSALALAHPGSVAPTSGEQNGWSHDMAAAPAGEEVEVGAGRMTFLAKLVPNSTLTTEEKTCDQWQATREGEHPPCWSDGCCWASNEDESASLQPDRWRRAAPPLERIRHVKSRGIYEVLCADAQIQTDVPLGDCAKVRVYRGEEPPHLTWVRPVSEMEDGRFEPASPPASRNDGERL